MKINVGNDSTKFGIIFSSAFTQDLAKRKKLFKMLGHMASGYVRIGPTLT